MLQCQECKRIIMDSTSDGGWKIRSRMLLFDSKGNAKAICPTCKHHVPVPIRLGNVENPLPKPKLILKGY